MAYCVASDVQPLLGDLEFPSSLSIDSYCTRASDDIDLALGDRYVVPLPTTDYFTGKLLEVVSAELAASMILMAQAQGGEDNRVNAYALHLFKRANDRLAPYLDEKFLPGGVLRATGTSGDLGPAMIYEEDSGSPVAFFYKTIQRDQLAPWPGEFW